MSSNMKMNPETHHFEARYENPWGGVASDAAPMDISMNQFNNGTGIVIKHGLLCSAGYNIFSNINFSTIAAQNYFSGVLIELIVVLNRLTIAISNQGHAFIYNTGTAEFVADVNLVGGPTFINISCFQVINGVLYIFDEPNGESYAYTPTVSFVVNSTFVGGLYCTVVDSYLLTANTNQPTDTPAVKHNRYNWSSPDGFASWNPALDRTSGFNTLADVQDSITGLFAMGNVGYVLRDQGVTQLTPNGIGIGPFDTTTLWGSMIGVGCTYPQTFAQYGLVAVWANFNNIYSFTSGGYPMEIGGSAKRAIYEDLNANEMLGGNLTFVSASISNTAVNSTTPELYYNLLIVTSNGALSSVVMWVYNFKDKAWTRQIFNLLQLVMAVTGNIFAGFTVDKIQAFGLLTAPANVQDQTYKRAVSSILVSGLSSPSGLGLSFVFGLYMNTTGVPTFDVSATSPLTLNFKSEEFELGRQPSVRGVAVKAAGQGTIHVAVNGVPFTDIVLNGSVTQTTYYSSGEYTGEDPQLQLTSTTLDGYIIKAYMVGSYAEGEIL